MPATQRVFRIEHLLVRHLYTGHCAALRIDLAEEAVPACCRGHKPAAGATGGDCHRRYRAHLSTEAAQSEPATRAGGAEAGPVDRWSKKTAATFTLKRRYDRCQQSKLRGSQSLAKNRHQKAKRQWQRKEQ